MKSYNYDIGDLIDSDERIEELSKLIDAVEKRHTSLQVLGCKKIKLFYKRRIINYLVSLNELGTKIDYLQKTEDMEERDEPVTDKEKGLRDILCYIIHYCKRYWRAELF